MIQHSVIQHSASFISGLILLSGLVLFSAADSSQAQNASTPDSRRDQIGSVNLPDFGVKAGINYSNVWDEQGQEFVTGSTYGFAGGVFLSIPVITVFSVQTELLFSQKGYRREGIFQGGDFIFSRTASYIDIPFQVQVNPAPFISILAGPHYSILIYDKWEVDREITDPESEELTGGDIRNNLMGLGGGVDVHIDRVVLSVRAGWDLFSNEGDGQTDEPRYKNRWLQLSAGYLF
ncbi:MAG: porin family protein [Balneolaceae bacterium]